MKNTIGGRRLFVLHCFVCESALLDACSSLLCMFVSKVECELKHLKCLRCKDVTMIVLGEEDLCDLR